MPFMGTASLFICSVSAGSNASIPAGQFISGAVMSCKLPEPSIVTFNTPASSVLNLLLSTLAVI